MKRIKSDGMGYEIAKRALSWIFYAKHPLHMVELREAIAVHPIYDIEMGKHNCRALDEDNLTDEPVILECCGSFILWDRMTDNVEFSHYTVSEFFSVYADGNIEPELYVARTSLTYLCFDVFGQGPCQGRGKLRNRVQKYRLAQYIAQFCGSHILSSKEEEKVPDLVLSILWSPARRYALQELAENNYYLEHQGYDGYSFRTYGEGFGGWTPLHFLAAWGLVAILKMVHWNTGPVHWNTGPDLSLDLIRKWRSRESDMADTITICLEDFQVNANSIDGATPLHNAAKFGHLEVVKFLVEKGGADVESKDSEYGQTPVSYAAEDGHLEVVKFLVKEAGADVESKDLIQKTPLRWAAENGHVEAVKFLVEEAGADVEAKDSDYGQTPLSCAAENGHLEAVKFLVEEGGANVESKDEDGQTPLSFAAGHGHLAIVKFLVEEGGADVESKDLVQMTPLSYAAWNGHLEVVKVLVKKGGANVESKSNSEMTPLSFAAGRGHLEVVKFLVKEGGADVESKDGEWGLTPLSFAAYNGHLEVVKFLVEEGGMAGEKNTRETRRLKAEDGGIATNERDANHDKCH